VGGNSDVRVRVLGCRGGSALARLEGARGGGVVGRRGGRGPASAAGYRRVGPEGGGLPKTGKDEAGSGEKNPSQIRHRQACGG
jgi:hypothetical protein